MLREESGDIPRCTTERKARNNLGPPSNNLDPQVDALLFAHTVLIPCWLVCCGVGWSHLKRRVLRVQHQATFEFASCFRRFDVMFLAHKK